MGAMRSGPRTSKLPRGAAERRLLAELGSRVASLTAAVEETRSDREALEGALRELDQAMGTLRTLREAIALALPPPEPIGELRKGLDLLRIQYPQYALLYHFARVLGVGLDGPLASLFPPGAFLRRGVRQPPSRATLLRCLRKTSLALRDWVQVRAGLDPATAEQIERHAFDSVRYPPAAQRRLQRQWMAASWNATPPPRDWAGLKARDWSGSIRLHCPGDHLNPPPVRQDPRCGAVLHAIRSVLGLDYDGRRRQLAPDTPATRGATMRGLVLLGLGSRWNDFLIADSPGEIDNGDAWLEAVNTSLFKSPCSSNLRDGWSQGWWPWPTTPVR